MRKGLYQSLLSCLVILGGIRPGVAGETSSDDEEVSKQLKENLRLIQSFKITPRTQEPTDLGISGNENFSVLAPRNKGFLAQEVLRKAEDLRKKIAQAWLNKELPAGEPFTVIHVHLSNDEDEGLSLIGKNGRHMMWLTTSRDRAVGSTLAHEMTHIVLSARFPDGMPVWANEGIASLADDASRFARRQKILEEFQAKGFPAVRSVMEKQAIHPTDETSYTVSVSLTEFFLGRGDRQTFLRFVAEGGRNGWDRALNQAYAIRDTTELQQQWQTWVGRKGTRPDL